MKGVVLLLVLSGVALPQTERLCNLRFLWTHSSCSRSKWQPWPAKLLHKFIGCPKCILSKPEISFPSHSPCMSALLCMQLLLNIQKLHLVRNTVAIMQVRQLWSTMPLSVYEHLTKQPKKGLFIGQVTHSYIDWLALWLSFHRSSSPSILIKSVFLFSDYFQQPINSPLLRTVSF